LHYAEIDSYQKTIKRCVMLLLRHWQQHFAAASDYFFRLLAEADTPESWGECLIPIDKKT
jgi:hypothetical protein